MTTQQPKTVSNQVAKRVQRKEPPPVSPVQTARKCANVTGKEIKQRSVKSGDVTGNVSTAKSIQENTKQGIKQQTVSEIKNLYRNRAKFARIKKPKHTTLTIERKQKSAGYVKGTIKRSIVSVLATAGVAAILSMIPSKQVTYIKPQPVYAAEVEVTKSTPSYAIPPAEALAEVIGPDEIVPRPHELFVAEVSAYTSSVDETDDTPNINAMGTKPGPGSIACPSRYAFGTLVFINGNEYRCDDRMNPRYDTGYHFDIWVETKAQAFQWGRRNVTVEVVQ